MDNGLVVLYLVLLLIAIAGISYLIVFLTEKYKQNKGTEYSRTASNNHRENSWDWQKKTILESTQK